jgi:hypothetical protein
MRSYAYTDHVTLYVSVSVICTLDSLVSKNDNSTITTVRLNKLMFLPVPVLLVQLNFHPRYYCRSNCV